MNSNQFYFYLLFLFYQYCVQDRGETNYQIPESPLCSIDRALSSIETGNIYNIPGFQYRNERVYSFTQLLYYYYMTIY